MPVFNIYEAKTQLSRLVDRAAKGEEILIARAGKPLAKLVPYREEDAPRQPGGWEGRVWIAPNFDAQDEDLLIAFEGETS
jgi:prevent-host-death family protein